MEKEFDLIYCSQCMQMTNHIEDVCQKCKDSEYIIIDAGDNGIRIKI